VLTDETAPQLLRRNLEANDALLTPHTSVKELDWDDFTPDACALSDSTAHVVAAFSHTEPPRAPPPPSIRLCVCQFLSQQLLLLLLPRDILVYHKSRSGD
jgi:hypothetical protein